MIDFDTAVRNINFFTNVINGKGSEPKMFTSSGFKVNPLKCQYCGGNIDVRSMICPFCDTPYSIDGQTPVVEKVEPWCANMMSPNEIRECCGLKKIF